MEFIDLLTVIISFTLLVVSSLYIVFVFLCSIWCIVVGVGNIRHVSVSRSWLNWSLSFVGARIQDGVSSWLPI